MKFVVDLCKTTEYTDSNGVTWWGDKYKGNPGVLKLYQELEGKTQHGITVVKVFEFDGIIKAHLLCDEDITGCYINPKIYGKLDDDKNILEVYYGKADLDDVCISLSYAVEDLQPCRLVGEL